MAAENTRIGIMHSTRSQNANETLCSARKSPAMHARAHGAVAASGASMITDNWDDEPTGRYELWLPRPRVLLAEDDALLRAMMARRLRADGLDVIEAENGDDAVAQLGAADLDLLVMDVRMPGRSGLEVAYLLRTWSATTPVVLVTAYPEPELFDEVDRIGATLLAKPFAFSHLSEAAMSALGRAS